MGGVCAAALIGERQAGLYAVGIGQPSEEVIEATILHHDYNDVLDVRLTVERESLFIEEGRGSGGGSCFYEGSAIHGVVSGTVITVRIPNHKKAVLRSDES